MKIMAARQAPMDKLDAFLKTGEHVDSQELLKEGYVVELEEEIKGCFILSTMDHGVYWLKQLYIAQEAASHLPVLLETILQMVKGKDAKKLYVHSHQPVVDLLLQALQFYPQSKEEWSPNNNKLDGNWWRYNVS